MKTKIYTSLNQIMFCPNCHRQVETPFKNIKIMGGAKINMKCSNCGNGIIKIEKPAPAQPPAPEPTPEQTPDEQETGICNKCGSELEAIMENNGFTEPEGPSKWEVSGYKPCRECHDDEE